MASRFNWLSDVEGMSPAQAMAAGMAALTLAVFDGMMNLTDQAFQTLGEVLSSFGAVRDLAVALLTEPITILEAAAEFTAFELTQGQWAFFGPFTWPVAVAIVMIGLMVAYYMGLFDIILPWRSPGGEE